MASHRHRAALCWITSTSSMRRRGAAQRAGDADAAVRAQQQAAADCVGGMRLGHACGALLPCSSQVLAEICESPQYQSKLARTAAEVCAWTTPAVRLA